MTEDQIKEFEQKYKDHYLPRYRLYATIPYNIAVAGLCIYYTINYKKISKRLFKPKKFNSWELFKFGTYQSVAFLSFYFVGLCSVSGLWNPIQYVRDIARIQGKIIDTTLKHDEQVQKYVLFNALEYFGLSQNILNQAKQELQQDKEQLEQKNYFSEQTKQINSEIEQKFNKYQQKNSEEDEDE